MAAIADGVQAAHAIGLLHSDLKPSNIVLTSAGEPKVADFGLARAWDQDPGSTSPSAFGTQDDPGSLAGNLAYISPEQFRGQRSAISPASDVYALGGILFYLLTRTFPNGATPGEVADRHSREGGPDRVVALRFPEGPATSPGIDQRLVSICLRALSPEPAARHANAGELAADLRAWLDHRPIAWMRPNAAARLRLSARRSPVLVTLAAIAVAVSLCGTFTAGYYAKSASAARREKTEAKDKTLDLIRNAYRDLGRVGAGDQKQNAETARKNISDLQSKIETIDKGSSGQ
jgi:serine/threonine protein kinase